MKKRQLILELLMPAVFGLAAIKVIAVAVPMNSEGVFPLMSAGLLLACSIYLFIEVLAKKRKVVVLDGVNLPMVGITLLVLIAYVFLLKKIGYVMDTFILCAVIIRILGYQKPGITALCSALAVALTFFVFKGLLSVPLPMVFLDF